MSQRGRATFRVVGNFARSLKVIRNHTVEYGVCKFLLVFHCLHRVLFLRYSTSNNGVHLKQSGLGVFQGHWLAVWLSGNTLASINVVALRQTRLVLGWVTVCGRVNHLGM